MDRELEQPLRPQDKSSVVDSRHMVKKAPEALTWDVAAVSAAACFCFFVEERNNSPLRWNLLHFFCIVPG